MKLVKTSRARTKIRHRLRQEQRERASALGRDLVDRALKKWGTSLAKAQKSGAIDRAAEQLKCGRGDQLLTEVGYGKVTAAQVAEVVVPPDRRKGGRAPSSETANPLSKILRKVTRRTSSSGIKVQGEDDVMVRFARCCNPLPGDKVVGFITRGRGVTVHTQQCDKALDLDPERRIDVAWDDKGKTQHKVAIQVLCADKPGLLAQVSQAFTDLGVNISQAHCRTTDDRRAVNTFQANVSDLDQLKGVMRQLSRIKGVFSVDRVNSFPG